MINYKQKTLGLTYFPHENFGIISNASIFKNALTTTKLMHLHKKIRAVLKSPPSKMVKLTLHLLF